MGQSVHCTAVSHQPFQPFCSMLGRALVWLVTASSRIVTAEKPSCSLLLTGQGGAATYTITNTELNINFAAESIELAGQCCFAIYSHPTKAKGDAMMVNSGSRLVVGSSLLQVGSAFMISCSENSGTIIMNCLLGVSAVLIALILIFALISTFGRNCGGQMVRRGGGAHHALEEEK